MYEYKTIPMPTGILEKVNNEAEDAALFLEKMLNEHGAEGWEFQGVESIKIKVQPGCKDAFFKLKRTYGYFCNVAIFRRHK